jgi:1-acyl-sn-glycerol-3-phosphate acyltransferase
MYYFTIIPRTLWKALLVLNFILSLIILYPFFYVLLSRKQWFPKAFKLKQIWAHWILHVPGIFAKIKREVPIDKMPKLAVYVANHTSYLDIVISYLTVPDYFIAMGKQEIEKAPLFRIFFKEMNILVDRKSNMGSHRAFVRAGEEIDKGHSIFLFPEGGILGSGKLHNFKNGAFKLAIEKQIPIVPITYLNNWKLLQTGGVLKAHGRPGIARVVVHEPISTIGLTENDLVSLRTQTRDIILNELNKYNAET